MLIEKIVKNLVNYFNNIEDFHQHLKQANINLLDYIKTKLKGYTTHKEECMKDIIDAFQSITSDEKSKKGILYDNFKFAPKITEHTINKIIKKVFNEKQK